jgi:cytochrome c peroxidase
MATFAAVNMKLSVAAAFLWAVAFLVGSFADPYQDVRTASQLGSMLFSEKALSKDSSVSCASCHKPQYAFADTAALSTGIYGKPTRRNTPSVLNMANRSAFFWDGRAATLQQQALMPISHPHEMGLPLEDAVTRLQKSPLYIKLFRRVFSKPASAKNLAEAIAAFERSLETDSSRFDIWDAGDGPEQLTESEERGRKLFIGDKAKCFDCHFGPDFTGDEFKNVGTYNGKNLNDVGRFVITEKPEHLGAFKVPGLRNVALTAPYMHNGMFTTLEQVVDFYNNALAVVPNAVNLDASLQQPLGLTPQEKADLVAFLKTLSDKRYLAR